MTKIIPGALFGKNLLASAGSARVLVIAVLFVLSAAAETAHAGHTVGNGVILFNYSSVTAYVDETSNPAPSCVNNQGNIPQPMTVGPGNISNPSSNNQDIEFTAQDGGGAAACQEFYLQTTRSVWQYPFSLSFSSGQAAVNYIFGSNAPATSSAGCADSTLGNIVGLYNVMPCVLLKFGEPQPDNTVWEYLNNSVVTVYPADASFYYTMTSLAGPAQGKTPSGVYPGVSGGGNACSAPNWSSCVLIQVYNVGQGPSSAVLGAQVLSHMADGTKMAPFPVENSSRLASAYPSIDSVSPGFEVNTADVEMKISASSVALYLVQNYGKDQLVNRLDMLLTVTGVDGSGVRLTKSIPLSVTTPTKGLLIPWSFSRNDAHAIQHALSNGRKVDIGVQILQHVVTPNGVFELPLVKHASYSFDGASVSLH